LAKETKIKKQLGDVDAKIENGKLHLILDVIVPLRESSTGKTLLVASTNGNKVTSLKVNGKEVVIGCNAYIKK